MSSRRCDRGYTLTEMMMVIFIIALMFALLMPFMKQTHFDGRRAQCQNNMKNIDLAILEYVNQNNLFPPSGMFMEDAETLAFLTPGSPTHGQGTGSVIPTYLPGQTSQRGVPMYSWVVPILPYLDSQELAMQWTAFTNDPSGHPTAVAYDNPAVFAAGQNAWRSQNYAPLPSDNPDVVAARLTSNARIAETTLSRMALGFHLKPLPAIVCAPRDGGRSGSCGAWAGA